MTNAQRRRSSSPKPFHCAQKLCASPETLPYALEAAHRHCLDCASASQKEGMSAPRALDDAKWIQRAVLGDSECAALCAERCGASTKRLPTPRTTVNCCSAPPFSANARAKHRAHRVFADAERHAEIASNLNSRLAQCLGSALITAHGNCDDVSAALRIWGRTPCGAAHAVIGRCGDALRSQKCRRYARAHWRFLCANIPTTHRERAQCLLR